MFHSISSWSWRVFRNERNQKYLSLTKIDISWRNKVDIENHYLCFSMLQLKRGWGKKKIFFFYNQISFPFSFSCTCLMDTFEKTGCNSMCKVFKEVFLHSTFQNSRIPHSTALIHFVQREKAILNLVIVVVGNLSTWIGCRNDQPIDWHKQNLYFKHWAMLQLKPGSAREVSHQTDYMGNCYSHFSNLMYLGCCTGSGKRNVSRMSLHEFDISLVVLQDGCSFSIPVG